MVSSGFRIPFPDQTALLSYLVQELDLVGKVITRVRYLRLKKELAEGENPEINTDKQALLSRMEELGFHKDIVEALQELDRRLFEAGKPLDFKGCMDLVRTIYEKLMEDAARKIATTRSRPLPQGSKVGPFQPWLQYVQNENILNEKEGELAQKLYNYLSVEGAHALGSAPEQVRVSKNMVIEFGLMLVGRVGKAK